MAGKTLPAPNKKEVLMNVTGETTVREVTDNYPDTALVFLRHGIQNPFGVEMDIETVWEISVLHHVDPDALIEDLNHEIRREEDTKW
jgi:hypothetical protein